MSVGSSNLYIRTVEPKRSSGSPRPAGPAPADPERIVVIVPRGEVVRNFVHSGALDTLAERAIVSLLSVSFDEETHRLLETKYGDIHPLTEHGERWLVRFEREILEAAHNRWVWSPASRSRVRLHDAAATTGRQKLIRTAKKSISRAFANRVAVEALSKIERVSSRLLNTTDEYLRLFRQIRPSMVFNGSHVHSRVATQAVQAAQWLKIPTATFIFSWDNLTSQGRIMLPYDYFLVWNDQLKDQLLQMYRQIRPEQVFVTGTPQFDFHFRPEFYQSREKFCNEVGADPKRPIVFYTTGMANHMPGEPELVEQIADVLCEVSCKEAPQLLVRVYPKDLTGRFEPLKKKRPDILFQKTVWDEAWLTPRFKDSFGLTNALRHCAVGINIASTISLELCMFDRPVINVGYNPPGVPLGDHRFIEFYDFDHYRPLVDGGAIDLARNPLQMREMIQNCLQDPAHRRAERKALIDAMFGSTLDGRSAQRVAKTIGMLAERCGNAANNE